MARRRTWWSNAALRSALIEGGASLQHMLFGKGENGFLFYPPSDLTRMFALSTGGTNVAANDDPVGLWLDNHSWNGASVSGIDDPQAELLSNGEFASGTGWSVTGNWSISGGKAVHTAGAAGTVLQTCSPVVGALYQVEYEVSGWTTGTVYPYFSGGTTSFGPVEGGNGVFTRYLEGKSGNTSFGFFAQTSTYNGAIERVSLKRVPDNHALNATSTQRPLYKTNSGKPYLNFDGTDDRLVSPFIPTTAGTVAAAFRASNASAIAIGGGTSTGNKRLRIGLDASGVPKIVFNASSDIVIGASDARNADTIIALTWDATGWEAWLNGVLVASAATAPLMDGTGNGCAIGSLEGGTSAYLSGRVYTALGTNDRVTPSEIARITTDFTRLF